MWLFFAAYTLASLFLYDTEVSWEAVVIQSSGVCLAGYLLLKLVTARYRVRTLAISITALLWLPVFLMGMAQVIPNLGSSIEQIARLNPLMVELYRANRGDYLDIGPMFLVALLLNLGVPMMIAIRVENDHFLDLDILESSEEYSRSRKQVLANPDPSTET